MKLSHRQIDFFRAVMGTGHVTRAAELLHTSQPTVSRELARLEQVLGFALFERIKGRLRPTVRVPVTTVMLVVTPYCSGLMKIRSPRRLGETCQALLSPSAIFSIVSSGEISTVS